MALFVFILHAHDYRGHLNLNETFFLIDLFFNIFHFKKLNTIV